MTPKPGPDQEVNVTMDAVLNAYFTSDRQKAIQKEAVKYAAEQLAKIYVKERKEELLALIDKEVLAAQTATLVGELIAKGLTNALTTVVGRALDRSYD